MAIELTGETLRNALKYLWYSNDCDDDRVKEIIDARILTEEDFPTLEKKIKGIDKKLEEEFGGYYKFRTIADEDYPSFLARLSDVTKIPLCFAHTAGLSDEELENMLCKENPYMVWIETENPMGDMVASKLKGKERTEKDDFQYCYYIRNKHVLRIHTGIDKADSLIMINDEYKYLCAKMCGVFVATVGDETIAKIINDRSSCEKLALPGKSGCNCNKLIKNGWKLFDCVADIEEVAAERKKYKKVEVRESMMGGEK